MTGVDDFHGYYLIDSAFWNFLELVPALHGGQCICTTSAEVISERSFTTRTTFKRTCHAHNSSVNSSRTYLSDLQMTHICTLDFSSPW